MTREEAIKRFQRMKKILSIPNSDAERTKEALDIAIEALKADTETSTFNKETSTLGEKHQLSQVVRCKDCRHANECHKSVQYTRNEPNTITIGYSSIEWCSHGERSE